MKKSLLFRAVGLLLALALSVLPASALTVEQARELLETYYVDPVPQEVLDQPTIPAMLEALGDPYTQHFTAEEYKMFLDTMSDSSLVGIGVSIPGDLTSQDEFKLQEVFEGGPAHKAGLLPGDVIVAVDHVDVQGMDPDDVVVMIRGEEGTAVSITYLRQGRRQSVTIVRETVSVPATTGKMLEKGVCYIQCTTWGEETLGHFHDIMGRYNAEAECWLIDLRGNLGGLTDAATEVAGLFCGRGNMLFLRYRTQDPESPDGYAYELYPSRFQPATDKPVIILVDGSSASSSEAFTAALRDYGVAVVIGERTYGKGVAQGLWDQSSNPEYFPDGDALKITLARFYSPGGNTNDTLGIIPDFLVYDSAAENLALNLAHAIANQGEGESWRVLVGELQTEFIGATAFSDVSGDPYEGAINTLRAYELVHGKGDGAFHSGDDLTRAELAQMLSNALCSWVPDAPAGFDDVPSDAWYADAVAAIAAQGFMEGTGNARFSPDATLTRQELFTVMGRLARWLNDDADITARRAKPADWELNELAGYAEWAKPSAWLLSGALGEDGNLLWDYPDAIDPTAPATRGETASVLYRTLDYLGILP